MPTASGGASSSLATARPCGKVVEGGDLTAFNLAVGNSDARAKNVSLLRPQDGSCSLAPAYDIAMHAHHQTFSNVFAMDVNGRRAMTSLTGAGTLGASRACRHLLD